MGRDLTFSLDPSCLGVASKHIGLAWRAASHAVGQDGELPQGSDRSRRCCPKHTSTDPFLQSWDILAAR